jgi:hypothetical protein
MPIEDDLLNEIRTVVGQTAITTHTAQSDLSDLYELYVFSLILEAAEEEGAQCYFRDVLGNDPTALIFRTGPGDIASTRQNYTHAVIQFPQKPALECHIGIYVQGQSEVAHECDVAVLYQTEAQTCRANVGHGLLPRYSKVLIAAECKYYTTDIKLGLARGFLGLVVDIPYYYGERHFVINQSPDSVMKLLAKHKKKLAHDLIPAEPGEVTKLKASFRETFDRFKVRG